MKIAVEPEPGDLKETDILDLLDSLDLLEVHVNSRLNGRVRDFQLVFRNGGLVLKGYTHTYYGRRLAEQLVLEATVLPIVQNDIEVL